ncbi:MAG: TonB-dependent receptor [Bacteroidia bacterium]|nr:TonB-dependent receptor [Bacteroidia bacterium]
MIKKIILLSFLLKGLITFQLYAQSPVTVSGRIKDAEARPVEGAIVMLYRVSDSLCIKTALSEADGKYELTAIHPVPVFFTVTHQLFKEYRSGLLTPASLQSDFLLPDILLESAGEMQTQDVVITATVPFIQRKTDRIVVNPDALIGNSGTTALEVLEKSPGVQVDANGLISLRGKQGVMVLIDDKPTYLSSTDLANYLKSLPSASLATIELMTNPPAKYEAEGNAGIINIRLKKTKKEGLNGSISTSYGQGFYARSNNSLVLNYRINKFNFFTNSSFNINNSYQDLTIKRTYSSASGVLNTIFRQRTFIKKEMQSANVKFGVDYYASKKSTFGIVLSGFRNNEGHTTSNLARIYDGQSFLQNSVTAYNPSTRIFKNGAANLNYLYKLDTLGREITINTDYIGYDSRQNQSLLSNTYLPDNTFVSKTNLVSELPAAIGIWSAKIDYVMPLKKDVTFESGVKTSLVNTKNIAQFWDEENGALTVNNDFSNNFTYRENINSAYINGSKTGKRFSAQLGLRFENTQIKGIQLGNASGNNDSTFVRSYSSLFPTTYLTCNLDSASVHQLGFSYGRRIERPDYQSMNPFTYPLDRFTLYAGNPFLQPTYSHNLELSHTYKNSITTTFLFSVARNVISETIEQNTNIFYSRPGNIGKQYASGITVDAGFPITKWWTLQFHAEAIYNDFQGELYNLMLRNKGWFAYFGPVNQFQFKHQWSAELAGSIQSSVPSAQFVTIPVWGMRAAVAKQWMKGKLSTKLSINDMFYTFQPGGDIKSLYNSTAEWKSYLDTRVLTVSLSYRFSSGQTLGIRTVGGADSERTRVK